MTAIVVASTANTPYTLDHPLVPYSIGCLGYVGLVFALFNKLYMGTKIMAALKLIFLSITAGLVVGVGLLLWTGMGLMACTATLVCGWMYGLGSWRYIHYRDDSNVQKWGEDHKLLSPQVLTSGQSWVGAQLAMTTMSHKAVLKRLEHLSPDRRIGISCESSRGQRLLASLKALSSATSQGQLHPSLEAAFGREGVVSILERAHEALIQNLAQL